MTPTAQLRARIASYGHTEAQALIHFLLREETRRVSEKLDMPEDQAREAVACVALDFLAGVEAKIPAVRMSS